MEIIAVSHNLPVNPVQKIQATGSYLREDKQTNHETQATKSREEGDNQEKAELKADQNSNQPKKHTKDAIRASQIRENLKNYQEAGLINQEEMKTLLAIMIPAGTIPQEEATAVTKSEAEVAEVNPPLPGSGQGKQSESGFSDHILEEMA